MEVSVLVVFLAIGVLPTVNAHDLDLEVDKSHWIDPTDMLNYDTAKRVMRKPAEDTADSKPVTTENKPNKTCEMLLEKCQKAQVKLQDCEKALALKQLCNTETHDDVPYMKRYVRQLLNHFYGDAKLQSQEYKLTVQLTEEDRTTLNKFVTTDRNNLREVDDIVSRMVVRSRSLSEEDVLPSEWAVAINMEFFIVVVALCAAWIALLKLSLFRCILLFVLISTFWHWKHLYQQAVARREAELAKLSDVPAECRSDEPQGFFYQFGRQALKKIFGKDTDNCEKYYKAVGVDPVWEVSPSVALSEAVGQFFTHPLGILGSNIGNFYYNLNENLPWFSYYILLTATLVFAFFALIAVFGYRIRLPFGIMSIEPTPAVQTKQAAPAQVCQAENSQPEIRSGAAGNPQNAERSVCAICHGQYLPTVKRKEVAGFIMHDGAGDHCSPKTRESVQEIKAKCSNDGEKLSDGGKSCAIMEAGDSPADSSLPSELNPNDSKFLSELLSTLKE